MPIKPYSIQWIIDDKQAMAAFKRGDAALKNLDRLAKQTAGSIEAAVNRIGVAYQGAASSAVATHRAASDAATRSVNAQVAGVDRYTKATRESSARRLAAEVGAQEKIDVGYYKTAMEGIKLQDRLRAATKKKADDIATIESKWIARDYQDRVKAEKRKESLDDLSRVRAEKSIRDQESIESAYIARDYQRRVANARRKELSEMGPMGRLAQLRRRDLTEEQIQAATRNKIVDVTNKKRIDAAMRAAGVERDSFAEGIAGAFGLSAAMTKVGMATAAITGTFQTLNVIRDGYEKIRKDAEAAAEATMTIRRGLREEAILKGEESSSNPAMKQALEFRAATGLDAGEASGLTKQFLGSLPIGVQKGNITEAVAKDLMTQVGVNQARQGGDAATRGDLAGILGQFGKIETVEKGLGQLEAIRIGLTEGRGDDSPLTRQLLKAAGSIVKEGGAVPSLPELSALIGVTSLSAGPEEAGTRAEQINRALTAGLTRNNKKKGASSSQSAYLKGLGITESDTMEAKLDKLIPDLAKAEEMGRDIQVYLGERGFNSDEERKAIAELVPNFGALKERFASSRAAQNGATELDKNRRFLESPAGRAMVGDQMKAVATVTKGLEGERLAALRRAVEAGPEIQEGDKNVFTSTVGDFFRGVSTGSLMNPIESGREERLRAATIADVTRRAEAAGVPADQRMGAMRGSYGATDFTAEYVNRVEELIAKQGGSLAVDTKAAFDRLSAAIEKSNQINEAQAKGRGPALAPPPLPVGAPMGIPLRQ